MENIDSLENDPVDSSERNQRWSLTEGCLPLKLIIYTYKALVSWSARAIVTFSVPPIVCPQGTNISYTQERGDKHFHIQGRDKHFYIERGDKHFYIVGGGQTFYVVGGCGQEHFDEEMYGSKANNLVSEANILVRKANKISAETRIFRSP